MEEWKEIQGFSNYDVSSFGQVRSKPRRKSKGGLLKFYVDTHGRYGVHLFDDNSKRVNCRVHRLVADAFIPNTEGKPQIDHINGDRLDNRVENLRWATGRENQINTKLPKNNTSGEKHIGFDDFRQKWRVSIRQEKGTNLQKRFKTKEEAIKFRDEMVKIHYDPNFYRSG